MVERGWSYQRPHSRCPDQHQQSMVVVVEEEEEQEEGEEEEYRWF